MRRVPQQPYPNAYLRRERDPRAVRRQTLMLACCLALAAGFVFAVRQQILAVEFGYKTESLRREREQLLDEQRRLLLEVEESSSPARLEQEARELGMQPARAEQIESATKRLEQPSPATRVLAAATTARNILRR
jgi:cell division protein FtsL